MDLHRGVSTQRQQGAGEGCSLVLVLNPITRSDRKREWGRETKERRFFVPPASSEQSPRLQPTVQGGGDDQLCVLLLAVVSFVPLVHGVFWRLHPFLLEELLELGQAHVWVLLFQTWQVELFKCSEGRFHPALGMSVPIIGNAGGREFRQTCIKYTSQQRQSSSPGSDQTQRSSGYKAEKPTTLPSPLSHFKHPP